MPRRQGGIGRHPGRSKKSRQKHVSRTSATSATMAAARLQREADQKQKERAMRRLPRSPPIVPPFAEGEESSSKKSSVTTIETVRNEASEMLRRQKQNANRCVERRNKKIAQLELKLKECDAKVCAEKEVQCQRQVQLEVMEAEKSRSEKEVEKQRKLKLRAEKSASDTNAYAEKEVEKQRKLKLRAEKSASDAKARAEKEVKKQQKLKLRAEKSASNAKARAEKEVKKQQKLKLRAEKSASDAIDRADKEIERQRRLKNAANERSRQARKDLMEVTKVVDRIEKELAEVRDKANHQRQLKNAANERARTAKRQLKDAKIVADRRLEKKRSAETTSLQLIQAYEDLKEETENQHSVKFQKITKKGLRGGLRQWPIWIVQLIIEQLVNGTPPSSISANIASQAALCTPGVKIVELPSLSFIRGCRAVLRIVGETMTSYRLARVQRWEQLFTDGTSRRQVPLQNLVIGILEDDEIKPLILSSSIILEDETSEQQCAAVLSTIKVGARRLKRWREVFEQLFPNSEHDIPDDLEMNIGKLGNGGALTSDTCNGARKTRRLLGDAVCEAAAAMQNNDPLLLHVDCWNHLRCVWFAAVIRVLSILLNESLKEELEAIDGRLRVSTSIDSLLRAVEKEFSLSANYPKGQGELFREWVETHHPGALLLHVERATGSRQDLAVEGAGAVYWNRKLWIEFLDERLRTPGDNILEENLFIILSSSEMIALARVCSILHLSICIPMRWLAGNSHTLAEFNWSVRSMGRAVDMLEVALETVVEDGERILDKSFMMEIFNELRDELPPFADYWSHLYSKKTMPLVADPRSKAVPFVELQTELFSPKSETNKNTSSTAIELGISAAAALLTELRDKTKATSEHLTSTDGKFSWGKTSDDVHKSGLRKMAVNDPAERSFGGTTGQIQCFGRVGLTNAGAVGQVRINGDFSRGIQKTSAKEKLGKVGAFHLLGTNMRDALLTVALTDAPEARSRDRRALATQRAVKRQKEEILRNRGLAKATEVFIDALYYYEMFHSAACWRTAAAADQEMKKLNSKTAKLNALKENIRMRVIGLGWTDLATPWSKDGQEFSPARLLQHLKMIIKEQRKRAIPSKAPVMLPGRKQLPLLGTLAADVVAIDSARADDTEIFEANARQVRLEREAAGVGDRYAELQPTTQPPIDDRLIGTRLDICLSYELDEGGCELRWCQGKVIAVSNGTNICKPGAPRARYKAGEAVLIRWDANKDRNEPVSESAQCLRTSKWNPKGQHTAGSWRLDVDVNKT